MKNGVKKIICGLLTVITMFSCVMIPSVFASATQAEEELGSMTVYYVDEASKIENEEYTKENVLIDGATFSIALVAKDNVGHGNYEWVRAIQKNESFTFDTKDMFDKEKMKEVASALVGAVTDKVNIVTKTTNEKGECTFIDLERGIYLVWESQKEGTATKYNNAVPFLIEIPDRSGETEDLDIEVYPKPDLITDKRISITGTKRWEGEDIVDWDEDEKKDSKKVYRPKTITLRLYANGVEVGKTITSAKKGWAYSFNGVRALDRDGNEIEYSIKEDKVKGYIFSQDEPTVGENTIVINVLNKVGTGAAQTSDDSHLSLWIALMGASASAFMLAILIPSKKKKKTVAEQVVEKHNQ